MTDDTRSKISIQPIRRVRKKRYFTCDVRGRQTSCSNVICVRLFFEVDGILDDEHASPVPFDCKTVDAHLRWCSLLLTRLDRGLHSLLVAQYKGGEGTGFLAGLFRGRSHFGQGNILRSVKFTAAHRSSLQASKIAMRFVLKSACGIDVDCSSPESLLKLVLRFVPPFLLLWYRCNIKWRTAETKYTPLLSTRCLRKPRECMYVFNVLEVCVFHHVSFA